VQGSIAALAGFAEQKRQEELDALFADSRADPNSAKGNKDSSSPKEETNSNPPSGDSDDADDSKKNPPASTPILDRWGMGAGKLQSIANRMRTSEDASLRSIQKQLGQSGRLQTEGAMSTRLPTPGLHDWDVPAGGVAPNRGGVVLNRLRSVLTGSSGPGEEWKEWLDLPSRLVIHRRAFLLSTVLNARRVETVLRWLFDEGIEDARDAGDAEALSRLSSLKARQYERQLELQERLAALKYILTRSLQERREENAAKASKSSPTNVSSAGFRVNSGSPTSSKQADPHLSVPR